MLASALAWLQTDGHRIETSLRRRLFALYRPPRWLPCWFHGLWYALVSRVPRIPVVIDASGDRAAMAGTIRRHRLKATHHLDELGYVCVKAHARALQDICACQGVGRIWEDREVRALLDVAVPSTDDLKTASRYTGKGVTIAIIDTGIYPHPDLNGRITAFQDFVHRRTSPYDDNGHGTHVAGCAAGSGKESSGRFKSPAPAAQVIGVKVLNKMGSGTMSSMLAGINWVIQNQARYSIRIMSMSLGAPAQSECAGDPLCQAVSKAWNAGIVTVVAAGNDGPQPRTISTPGINPQVITVGAMDDRGTVDRSDDVLASFSSRGPTPDGIHKPDILSPGVGITSLRSPGSYLDKQDSGARTGRWYFTLSGTSMATPIIAGICAQLLEAQPELSPDEVKARLQATAEDRHLQADAQGAGYVNVDRATFGPEGTQFTSPR
ncbi:MAG: S8 family peptidase [Firmicutes bacterium]|nr:S8 family peptidase [Bacillota bacterium]